MKWEQRYAYTVQEQQLYRKDIGVYTAYALQVWERGNPVAQIADVGTDRRRVEELAHRCALGQPSLNHLHDIVEDFLGES